MSCQMMSFTETFIANGTLEFLFAFSSIRIGGNLIFVMTSHMINEIAGHSYVRRGNSKASVIDQLKLRKGIGKMEGK